jgi:hypothetical protein
MTGCIRRPPVRRVLTGVGAAVAAWLVWRLIAPGAPPAEAIAAVLGGGLGLLPVHVTLLAPHRGGGRRTTVRRPAQTSDDGAGRWRTNRWDKPVEPSRDREPG